MKTDFHALRVLVAVYRTGSISACARQLDLNQSTISYTIERLRSVFQDGLFVRVGRGITPTERCESIVAGAAELLRGFDGITRPETFDPTTTTDRLTISCNFYERRVLVPALMRRLRESAPGLRLNLIQAQAHGHEQLLNAECDLLISPLLSDTSGLFTRSLFEERYACFVDHDSAYARNGITLEVYQRGQHVMVNYEGGWKPFYRETLAGMGIDIEPSIEVPSFGAVGGLVRGTQLILTAPAALAPEFAESCVKIEAPFDCRFSIKMFWSARAHVTPINRWLRDHVVAIASSLAKPPRHSGGGPE